MVADFGRKIRWPLEPWKWQEKNRQKKQAEKNAKNNELFDIGSWSNFFLLSFFLFEELKESILTLFPLNEDFWMDNYFFKAKIVLQIDHGRN